jgi:hypothetical protein
VAIEQWHWGKIVILWAWGGTLAAMLMTVFVSEPVASSPARSALSLFLTVIVLLVLSAITWRWLGGRERRG